MPSGAQPSVESLTVTAIEAGPAGAEISVEVAKPSGGDVPEDQFNLIVRRGATEEVFENLSFSRAKAVRNVVEVVNKESKLIRVALKDSALSVAERVPSPGKYSLAAAEVTSTALAPVSSKVIVGDATESLDEIPENYFDCVILFDVLEHLNDPFSLLDALKTKLTDVGVIIASIPNIRYYRTFFELVVHGNWDYKDQGILDRTHLRFFTYKSMVKMFNSLNYKILQMEGIHPTSSRTYKILNAILLNSLADVRYKHFVIVINNIYIN